MAWITVASITIDGSEAGTKEEELSFALGTWLLANPQYVWTGKIRMTMNCSANVGDASPARVRYKFNTYVSPGVEDLVELYTQTDTYGHRMHFARNSVDEDVSTEYAVSMAPFSTALMLDVNTGLYVGYYNAAIVLTGTTSPLTGLGNVGTFGAIVYPNQTGYPEGVGINVYPITTVHEVEVADPISFWEALVGTEQT